MQKREAAAWLRELVARVDQAPTDTETDYVRGYQAALRDLLATVDGRPRQFAALGEPLIGLSHTARLARSL